MSNLKAYQMYQQQSVYTLTPGELIVLLYDEAIMCMNKAIMRIKQKNICESHNSIVKAQNIFLYLIDNLDMRYPISKNLLSLYDFISNQLVKANVQKNYILLEEVLSIATELRNTWKEAEKINHINSSLGEKCV
jgi:flagellar protein FliS